jgi:hypothetical protein
VSQQPDDRDPDDDSRTRANVFAIIAVLLLAAGALWLIRSLDEHRKLMDCVASGRRDCLERIEPAAAPPPGG